MSAAELFAELTRLNIRLEARGDRLRYFPRSAVTPELAERITAHKPSLLAILRTEADARTIDPTSAPSVWQAALDLLEGDELFPTEMLETMRTGNARWVGALEIDDPIAVKQPTISAKEVP